MTHTKGPRIVAPKRDDLHCSRKIGTGPGGWLGCAAAYGDTQDEADANAALIDAAPFLLATLSDVDELCQQGLNSPDPKHWEASLQDIMAAVRIAVSKAEGHT